MDAETVRHQTAPGRGEDRSSRIRAGFGLRRWLCAGAQLLATGCTDNDATFLSDGAEESPDIESVATTPDNPTIPAGPPPHDVSQPPEEPAFEQYQPVRGDAYLGFPAQGVLAPSEWTTEPAFEALTFDTATSLHEAPGSGALFITEREGRVYAIPSDPGAAEKKLVLDISGVTQGFGDSGLLDLAFHPEFGDPSSPNSGYVYLHYAYSLTPHVGSTTSWSTPSHSRLSRFSVDLESLMIDPESELVLIDQYDQSVWHQGGALFFGPDDGFLYLSLGDGGGSNCQLNHCQRLDRSLFSGVLRIDVDAQGGSVSHPIGRQPNSGTTQHYYIPSDNPFVGQDGVLEEFYAVGLRSPHRMTLDPVSGSVWLGDVGQGAREEIDILKKAANYQWPVYEGFRPYLGEVPEAPIGIWSSPLLELDRSEARSIIGGYVYRGEQHPELRGKYVFADYGTGKIWALAFTGSGEEITAGERELLVETPFLDYAGGGITSFGVDARGELYILRLGAGQQLRRLARRARETNLPRSLSETGAFLDTETLTPSPELLSYDVRSPLYSDGARKRRWVSIPRGSAVQFAEQGPWRFPPGTVLVKHFDIALDERRPHELSPIETRFLIADESGGYYGASYKWLPEQTDAELVAHGELIELAITASDGGVRRQPYFIPGPSDCGTCHNASAGHVLGLRTAQLNRAHAHVPTKRPRNQLSTWSAWGLLDVFLDTEAIASFPKLAGLGETQRSLEDRVRSYWDSNCSMCHGSVELRAEWDARYSTPLEQQGVLSVPAYGSVEGDLSLIAPGDIDASLIFLRSASTAPELRMPPLGRHTQDDQYLELLALWILSLSSE